MPREVIGSEQSGQRVAIIDTTNEFPSTKPIGFFQRLSFRRRNTEITPDDTTIYPDINRTWSILKKEYGEFKDFIVGYLSDEEGATASTSKFQVPLGTGGRRDKPTIKLMYSTDSAWEKKVEGRAHSVKLIAEKIGILPEKLDWRTMRVFIFLHEAGHGYDWQTNYADKKDGYTQWSTLYKTEKQSLPIPGYTPGELERVLKTKPEEVIKLHPQLQDVDLQSIVHKQEEAYRQLPSEDFADRFAISFMKRHASELGLQI